MKMYSTNFTDNQWQVIEKIEYIAKRIPLIALK